MKRKTKHLLELDAQVLLTALQNEKQRVVEYVRLDIGSSLDGLTTKNSGSVLPSIIDFAIEMESILTKLDNAIEELKEQTINDNPINLKREVPPVIYPDDIPF